MELFDASNLVKQGPGALATLQRCFDRKFHRRRRLGHGVINYRFNLAGNIRDQPELQDHFNTGSNNDIKFSRIIIMI